MCGRLRPPKRRAAAARGARLQREGVRVAGGGRPRARHQRARADRRQQAPGRARVGRVRRREAQRHRRRRVVGHRRRRERRERPRRRAARARGAPARRRVPPGRRVVGEPDALGRAGRRGRRRAGARAEACAGPWAGRAPALGGVCRSLTQALTSTYDCAAPSVQRRCHTPRPSMAYPSHVECDALRDKSAFACASEAQRQVRSRPRAEAAPASGGLASMIGASAGGPLAPEPSTLTTPARPASGCALHVTCTDMRTLAISAHSVCAFGAQ